MTCDNGYSPERHRDALYRTYLAIEEDEEPRVESVATKIVRAASRVALVFCVGGLALAVGAGGCQ